MMDKQSSNLTEIIQAEIQTDSHLMFDGRVIQVFLDSVRLPDGKIATREVVRHPGAVSILATTPDNQIILVEQHRYPCGENLLEIPAGKLDIVGENPKNCALRELAEETPYTAQSVDLIYTFYTSAGFSDEKMYLYRAHNIQANSTASCDEDEYLQLRTMTQKETLNALKTGKIKDAKTIIAMQFWLSNQ